MDPETARLIEQRLDRLLLEPPERAPRRAAAPQETASVAETEPVEEWDDWPDPDPPRTRRPVPGRLTALALNRAHLGVVGVLAVLALLAAGFVVLRAKPVAVATPLPAATTPSSGAPSAAPTPTTSPTPSSAAQSELVVHVLGAVRKPGLVRLPARSRVADAIKAAGGLRREADPDRLNLAALVADGEQVFVGTTTHPAGEVREGTGGSIPSASGGSTSAGGGSTTTVDLNTATAAQLEDLPGVGPVTAGKIVAWRTEHGRFSKVEELQEVSGIGPKTYAEIAPHCTV